MSSKNRLNLSSTTVRYGGALAAVAMATAVRLPFDSLLGPRLPYTTYFIAVIFIAIYGGLGPALLSAALGALLGDYLFVAPRYSFAIADSFGVLQVVAFCVLTTVLSILIKVIQDARRRAGQNEAALRESEERFRTMADATPVMLWLAGIDGLCTFFNQPWLDFTGRTMEEEVGFGWAFNVHPGDLQRCLDVYRSSIESHISFKMEYRLRRSDAEYRWVLNEGVPRCTKEGEIAGYAGSCIDITDRKQAEEASRLLGAIVESSEDAILGKTLDGTIVSWNAAAERIYGYSAQEVKGRAINLLYPPDRIDELSRILETLRRGESISHLETVWARKDGTPVNVALTISPTRDDAGNITGASAIARDITGRKRAEEERSLLAKQVEDQRQRLNKIVENVPGVVWEAWGEPDRATQ